MKFRVSAILQLILMFVYINKPLLPYIEYAIFKDYIAKNLCINRDKPKSCCEGKCHLKKQIEKNAENNNNDENSARRKISNQEVKEFLVSLVLIPKPTEIKIFHKTDVGIIFNTNVDFSIFVPPKTSTTIS